MAVKLDEARVRLLKITDTDGNRHIAFSRGSYNYIAAPSNGVIGLIANDTLSAAGCAMVIATNSVYPGATNAINLGTSSYKWANVYATTFTGNLSGNATSATSATSASSLKGAASNDVPLTDPGAGTIKYYYNIVKNSTGNMPSSSNANGILYLNTHSGEYGYQLGFSSDGNIYYRSKNSSAFTSSVTWNKILSSNNYTSYTVTKTGSGASGNWGINITGSAAKLTTPRAINGTNFDGSAAITTANWGTTRTLTIGNTGKSVNGSGNVSWTLADIGASDTKLLRNNYVSFTVGGDADTYYPVLIDSGHNSLYGWEMVSISRGYSATAPDTWNNATHKGALTLTLRWSGDTGWGGNDKTIVVEEFNEQYSTMVGGLTLSVNGLIAWLRGGGAIYYLTTPYGKAATATVHLTDYTASDKKVYSARSYNADTVNTEVKGKWYLRSDKFYGSAFKLMTARTINGTNFDGSKNITTANWGTSRNITIKDGSGNKGTAVAVNGGANVELILPTTIAATVSAANKLTVNAGDINTPVYFEGGVPKAVTSIDVKSDKAVKLDPGAKINGTTFTGESDITTSKWGTARTISISSTAGTTGTSINGSANASLIVPSAMTGFSSITSTKLIATTVASDTGHIVFPDGGQYTTTSSTKTGYLKITLPVSWSSAMMRFYVDIYNFSTGTSVTYMIGGYNYTDNSKWLNVYAQAIGAPGSKLGNLSVRFGHDGSKCAIYIGAADTSWDYPQVMIRDLYIGFRQDEANYTTGWSIDFTTTLGTISQTVENTNTAYKLYTARSINGTSFDGSANITTANWGTSRTLTIGNKGHSVNGSGNVSWTLADIGAVPKVEGSTNGSYTVYRALGNIYKGGTAITYYRIALPQATSWGMIMMKLAVRENYRDGSAGEIIIYANHSSTAEWNNFYATCIGKLSTNIKVYGSDKKYFYIAGNFAYAGLSIELMTVGDSAASVNLSNVTLDTVATLPTTYQTATMYYSLHSGNYNDYAPTKTGSGASGTWGISITGNAATATKLATPRAINGTSFDGSSDITTSKWGTARNIYIADSDSSHTGVAVSVNGSGNATLKLPSTIKATLIGNADSTYKLKSSVNLTGNSSNKNVFWNPFTWEINTAWSGCSGIYTLSDTENDFNGIFRVRFKNGNGGTVLSIKSVTWLSASTSTPPVLTLTTTINSESITYKLYISSGTSTYRTYKISKIVEEGTAPTIATAYTTSMIGTVQSTAEVIYASTASKLATARNIAISGTASSSVGTFDGSANTTIYIPTTISGFESISTKKITSPANTALQISPTYTLYLDSGASTSIVFRQGGTARARFNTSGHFVPEANDTYYSGTSSLKWKGVYATTFYGNLSGNATSATKATQDASGNTITSKYVAVDTTQTISGVKTFSKAITLSTQNYITISDRAYILTKYSDFQCSSLTPGNTSGNEEFMKAALKAMCSKYPEFNQPIFLGNLGPNSQGPMYGSIYNTSTVDSTTGLPQYSTFWFSNLNGSLGIFGTSSYNYYYRNVLDSSNYTTYTVTKTGSGASGNWGISISGNAATATKLATARTINGTSFDGSGNITTSYWGTSRTLTIGNKGHSVNGSGNVSWTLNEIGALPGKTTSATTAATAGWYRIATTASGQQNNLGQFTILANPSGKHCLAIINAGVSYGYTNGINLQQISYVKYGSSPILTKARIVYNTTYNETYAYLEVYVSAAVATSIQVQYNGYGWSLVTPSTVGSVPSDYTTKEITFVNNSIVSDLSGKATSASSADTAVKLTTPRAINGTNFDGSGAITTAKWGTARTLTIGNTGKSVNGSGSVSWSIAEIGALALTGGTISGKTYINTSSGTNPFYITRNGGTSESTAFWQDDNQLHLDVTNDETTAGISFKLSATDTEASDGSKACSGTITFAMASGATTITANNFAGKASSATKLATARNITISETASNSVGTFDGSANTTIYMPLTISGFNEIKTKKLTITNTSAGAHIAFSRGSWNYFTAPASGCFAFSPNGREASAAGAVAVIDSTGIIPGNINNTFNLGSSTYKWKNVYATTFTGALSGNATTATTLQTARSINGTSFDGSSDITTSKWGTARTVSISSAAGTSGTSVNGSSNIALIVPKTMTGFSSITSTKFVGALGESYLTWGGKNFAGNHGPLDAALIPELGANRLAFVAAAGIQVEYSTNGGSTWVDYGATDAEKKKIFAQGGSLVCGKNTDKTADLSKMMLRITLDTNKVPVYTTLNKFAIYVSTSGASGCYCTIDASLESTPTTFVTFADQISINGWSGWNIINTNSLTTFGNTASAHYGIVRFTFGCTGRSTSNYAGLSILRIMGFGGVGWNTPSSMAQRGTIYSYDENQNVNFPAQVTATQFNGTLNGNATSAIKDGSGNTIASTYLKLSGGTMTGNLTLPVGADAYSNASLLFGTATRIGTSTANTFGIYSTGKIMLRPNDGTMGYSHGFELSTTELIPTENNTVTLGNSTHKWANIYATTFTGNLSGTATKATQDGDGNVIKNTYLKLAGGTMTGNLQIGNSSSSATTADAVGISVRDLREVSMAPSTLGDKTAVFYFDAAGPSGDASWKGILRVKGWTDAYAAWELAGPANSSDTKEFYVRSGLGGGTWGSWRKLLTSDNYNSYAPTLTGTGASGTWGISVTGSSASCTGNAATATAIQTAGTTAQFYRGDNTWSNTIKQTANAQLGIGTDLKIGTARKDLNFDIGNGSGSGINDGYAGGITWGNSTSAYAGIYYQSSGNYGTRLLFATTGSYANGAYARMIIQSNGNVGIGTLSPSYKLTVDGDISGTKVYGAVWNDYAEYRSAETVEPGRVVQESSDGIMKLTIARLQAGCEIISDTFGFAIGETDNCKTPVATSGRVLAYTFEDRDSFELGQAVCSGPNGTVSKMTREEIMMYPERILGTVSEIPTYTTWGTGNVDVNGRIWIRIR